MKLNKDFPHRLYLDKRVLVNGVKRNIVNYENHIELAQWIQDLINLGEITINVCDIFTGVGSEDEPLCVTVPTNNFEVLDTNSVNLTLIEDVMSADVKISATSGNQISISSDGLYVPQVSVPSQTPLTVVDTSTIDFSTSGTNSHTLTGSVIIPGLISSDASNQVTTGTDGKLFVPVPSSTTITANNGLTKTVDNIQLGGALVANTSITGNFDMYFGNKNYIFGDDNSFIGSSNLKFIHKITKSLNSLSAGYSTNFKFSDFTIDTGFSLGGSQGLFNDNNLTRLNVNNSKTISYSSKAANQTSYVQLRGVGTSTLTMSSLNGNIGTFANHLAYLQLDNATDDAANKVTITDFANYHSLVTAVNTNHNALTNFYHVFLADTTNNLATPSYITNKFGIYQEGTLDKNVFFGDVILGSSSFIASSKLTIASTTQGFLPPRMTTTNKNAISSPAEGLIVYDTTLHKLCVRTASSWEVIQSV